MIGTEAADTRITSVKIQFSKRVYASDPDVFHNYCPCYASTPTPY